MNPLRVKNNHVILLRREKQDKLAPYVAFTQPGDTFQAGDNKAQSNIIIYLQSASLCLKGRVARGYSVSLV